MKLEIPKTGPASFGYRHNKGNWWQKLRNKITATHVHYIKLGPRGMYEKKSLEDKRLYLGYHEAPERDCLESNWEAIAEIYRLEGHKSFVASNHTRQVREFYELPETCLWITFIDGCMWWTFAESAVTMCLEENWQEINSKKRGPSRFRTCIDQWQNTDLEGKELLIRQLPGYVTKVTSGFRGTICQIKNADAVQRIINAEIDPKVEKAVTSRDLLVADIERVIDRLHWKDFEALIDLIFQRSGWPRVSRVGGNQKLIEFELENPVSGEYSFVQVKSQAKQKTLDEYVNRLEQNPGFKNMYFVCHTTIGKLNSDHPDVILWTGPKVAEMTVKTGLTDWVLERV